ncbi:MAG: signal peptidase I [Gemmatimonadota bacterium]
MAKQDRRKKKRGSDDEPSEEKGEKGARPVPDRWTRAWLVDWAKTLAFAFVIFIVFRTFLLATFVITSGSMENTLLVGDFLLVNKTSLGSPIPGTALRIPGYAEPKQNDIIVFRSDHAPGLDIIKRTIGIPGDTLWMTGAVLFRNGERVDEPYLNHDSRVPDGSDATMVWQLEYLAPGVDPSSYQPTRDNWGPIVIPDERYFMLGDNREHSLDSRYWGLVERKKMKGKPLFVYYSYDREAIKILRVITTMRPGRIGPSPK